MLMVEQVMVHQCISIKQVIIKVIVALSGAVILLAV
jgi:hypothetical protein